MGVFADKPYVNGRYILSDTSKNYILEMNTLMNGLTMDDIRVLVGNRFRFPVYPDAEYMQTDILALDISQRAYNALRRGQISTIDQLANNINYEGDLRNFRNLGEKINTMSFNEKQASVGKPTSQKTTTSATGPETLNDGEYEIYTVRRGDSLWEIARTFNVTEDDIKRWNGLNSSRIDMGQKLKIKR